MNMLYRYDSDKKDLVIEVMEYFREFSQQKSVLSLVRELSEKTETEIDGDYILYMCSRLQEERVFHLVPNDIFNPIRNNYRWIIKDESFNWKRKEDGYQHVDLFNATIFGFEYVFNLYKDIVYPIITRQRDGEPDIGTGFAFGSCIVTAKHCIVDPDVISIMGFSKEELDDSVIYIDENDKVDIAVIDLGRSLFPTYTSTPFELEEVMVMGYPKIPQFVDFLTAEKAVATSVKASQGSIASKAFNFVLKEDFLLLTAKIKGGNSGSPVINKYGIVKGVAVRDPKIDNVGNYDDLGYGIAYTVEKIDYILEKKFTLEKSIRFIDVEDFENAI